MNKMLVVGAVVVLLVAVVAGIGFYVWNFQSDQVIRDDVKTDNSKSITEENFSLKYEYKGDNTWSYNLTGTLPNPCYSLEIDELVMESYPEQVQIDVTVTEPAEGVMCAQVIQEVDERGTFMATGEATVSLNIVEVAEVQGR